MNSAHIISQDVFDKIRSRFQNLEMGDESGSVTSDPKLARFFDFDFVVEGDNLGRVSISINETGTLKIFYSQGILEGTNDVIHHLWYDFLREMRMFAKRRLLRFDTRDITKNNLNKDDFQYLAIAGNKDAAMNESLKFEGSKMKSYRVLERTKVVVKHKKKIENEANGARSRKNNIESIFIENQDGERFKYPFIHIAGAKAMQRHVANGGRPYDSIGNYIIKLSEEISKLTAFRQHVPRHDGLNQEVNEIISRTGAKLEDLRAQINGLGNQGYYEQFAENFSPVQETDEDLDEATLLDYKSKFTINSFKEDLAQYFPLIHKIMKEANTVGLEDIVGEDADHGHDDYCDSCDRPSDECVCDDVNEAVDDFKSFEEWANALEEGRIEPDTLMSLKELIEGGLTLGVDGISAIEALEGIGVFDESLELRLKSLADPKQGGDPQNDPVPTIKEWLAQEDPEAAYEFGYMNNPVAESPDEDSIDGDASPTEKPSKPTPRHIAELVYSMYNREEKNFPKGKTGVITHVSKELGEAAGHLAAQLVDYLQPEHGQPAPHGPQNDPELESIKALAGIKEAVEDRSSYKVAKYLFDKGLRYNPQNEKQIINKMDDAMIAMHFPAKTIQFLLRHDEDFISDTLSELQHMEAAVDELAVNSPVAMAPAEPPMEEGADMDKIPAYVRKQKQQSQDTAQKANDERNKKAGAKVWSSPRTNEELSIIAKLAGLAK